MKKLRLLFIFHIVLVTALYGQANHVSVESKVDRSKITIGDRITYSIIVTHGEKIQVEFPDFGGNLGAFEILDYRDPEPRVLDSMTVLQRDYIISTFDTGDYSIPAVAINFVNMPDTVVQQLETEEIKITVESLKPSEAGDIRDIKDPLELERNYMPIIKLGVIIFCLILLGILIYVFIRRRRGQSILPLKTKPALPPHIIALNDLNELVNSDLWASGDVKEYYVRLSDIIRIYIEGRYSIKAPDMTTSQLVEMFKIINIDDNVTDRVELFLSECDLVKFAKYIPDDDEKENATQTAYDIIDMTKLEIEEKNEDENGEQESGLNVEETQSEGEKINEDTNDVATEEVN